MINLIKNQLRKIIKETPRGALWGLKDESLINIEVFPTEKSEFGHYSTNVAFKLAKTRTSADSTRTYAEKTPMEIAKEIANKFAGMTEFEKVEAVAPGFVNFWISPGILHLKIKEILKGHQALGTRHQGQEINVEFVSANPTGPLTMANGRGGFYGDVLANVLEKVGNKVTREFYINDAGNQIKILGESVLAELGCIPKKTEYYQGEYIKGYANFVRERLNKIYKAGYIGGSVQGILVKFDKKGKFELLSRQNIGHIGVRAKEKINLKDINLVEPNIKAIKQSLKNAGIKHDVWFSEDKKLRGKKGLTNKILEQLINQGLVVEKDGAKWLKTSEIAEEKDRVLVKSDGQPTYFLSDIAYHYDKFINRKFNLAVDIWGADHHGYVARLKSGVKALGVNPDRLKIIITQMVRLMSGGKEIKMSKRTGEFVTMDELLKEVGADAARFFFLMHSADTHMDFDLDLAKEHSQKNPVYYAQYAYVRALNILNKAKASKDYNLRILISEAETRLMLELVKLPDLIRLTAEDYQVHRLTKYASELARSFHNFYEQERVVGIEDKNMEKARLALVLAVKNVLGEVLDILGISKPKRM